jgi:hypothetical protein
MRAISSAFTSAFTAYAPPRFIKIFTPPSSLLLLPWLLLDPVCQIYGGLLVRIGTAGVLHLNVHKIKTATFLDKPRRGDVKKASSGPTKP